MSTFHNVMIRCSGDDRMILVRGIETYTARAALTRAEVIAVAAGLGRVRSAHVVNKQDHTPAPIAFPEGVDKWDLILESSVYAAVLWGNPAMAQRVTLTR